MMLRDEGQTTEMIRKDRTNGLNDEEKWNEIKKNWHEERTNDKKRDKYHKEMRKDKWDLTIRKGK